MPDDHEIIEEDSGLPLEVFERHIVGPFFIVRMPAGNLKLECRAVRAKMIDNKVSRNALKLLARNDITFEQLAEMLAAAKKGGYSDEAKKYFLDGLNGFIDRTPAQTKEVFVPRRLKPTEILIDKYLFAKMWLAMVRGSVEQYISTPQASITRIGLMFGINDPNKRTEKWRELRDYIKEINDGRKSQSKTQTARRDGEGTDANGNIGTPDEAREEVPMRNDLLGPDRGSERVADGEEVSLGV